MALHSKWVGNLLRFFDGSTDILDIDGANGAVDVKQAGGLKIAGVAIAPTAAQLNLAAQGVAAGYKVARGVGAVTGTLDVTTGLATVVAFAATMVTDPAIGTAMWASAALGAAGHITLKTWKPTAANDATPIAGTGTPSVAWIAIGT